MLPGRSFFCLLSFIEAFYDPTAFLLRVYG